MIEAEGQFDMIEIETSTSHDCIFHEKTWRRKETLHRLGGRCCEAANVIMGDWWGREKRVGAATTALRDLHFPVSIITGPSWCPTYDCKLLQLRNQDGEQTGKD